METLKEAFNEKYPAYSKRILEKFEKVNKCEANWENITKPNLAKFVNSLERCCISWQGLTAQCLKLFEPIFRRGGVPEGFGIF